MQGGRTNTNAALRMALRDIFVPSGGDRSGAPNIIIMVTDGRPNPHNERELNRTVDDVKRQGIRVIAVGIGTQVDDNIMRQIVTAPASENYFQIRDFASIVQELETILRRACTVCRPRVECKF